MKKKELFILAIILLGAFVVRLYKIDSPIADWHSWRQADTASVTRVFVQEGIDLLHPRYHDLSNIASSIDNPKGYRFVEFPLYNAVSAIAFMTLPAFSLEVWGRLVTIFASLLSLIFLFLLTRKYLGVRVGLQTAFFFGCIPYSIFYSRTILPDPSMVMAILGGIYFFDRWIEKKLEVRSAKLEVFFAVLLTASAFLLKPFALFFAFPMAYLAYRRFGIGFVKKPQLWIFALATLIPLIAWRMWISQYPEGIPASNWLFNEGNIRFKGAFFYWIFADRIGRLILGYFGIALVVLGLVRKPNAKEGLLFYSLLASSLLYLSVIAGGNVKHDYYQILIVPALAIFLAKGADFLLSAPKELFNRIACYLLLVTCVSFMLGFGWYHIREYYHVNNPEIVAAGKIVDQLTPKDAKIIAAYGGDSAFLYQTNRKGWPIVTNSLDVMVQKGATYLAVVNPDEGARNLARDYRLVFSSENFVLYDLLSKTH